MQLLLYTSRGSCSCLLFDCSSALISPLVIGLGDRPNTVIPRESVGFKNYGKLLQTLHTPLTHELAPDSLTLGIGASGGCGAHVFLGISGSWRQEDGDSCACVLLRGSSQVESVKGGEKQIRQGKRPRGMLSQARFSPGLTECGGGPLLQLWSHSGWSLLK